MNEDDNDERTAARLEKAIGFGIALLLFVTLADWMMRIIGGDA